MTPKINSFFAFYCFFLADNNTFYAGKIFSQIFRMCAVLNPCHLGATLGVNVDCGGTRPPEKIAHVTGVGWGVSRGRGDGGDWGPARHVTIRPRQTPKTQQMHMHIHTGLLG